MIRDEDLKSSVDYSEGQKEAAHRILVELVNIFGEYEEDIRIVGGWVPDLMFPGEGHIGSVDVDILAGKYGGTQEKKRSQHIQGMRALKATGGNFAFDYPSQKISLEARRPDGAVDVANVSVIAVVPYLIMKTAAMGRGKAKDAYDIYFLIRHYRGGVKELAKEFQSNAGNKLVQEMEEKLACKFASPDHAGPKDIVDFLGLMDEDEIEMTKRDAYEQMQALVRLISV